MTITFISNDDHIIASRTFSTEMLAVLEKGRQLNGAETIPTFLENVIFDVYRSLLLQPDSASPDVAQKRKELEHEFAEFVNDKVIAARG